MLVRGSSSQPLTTSPLAHQRVFSHPAHPFVIMSDSYTSTPSQHEDGASGAKLVYESNADPGAQDFSANNANSKEFEATGSNTKTKTVVLKKSVSNDFSNFEAMTSATPVCHLLYEDIDSGSFYLQWKPDSTDHFKNSVMMMVPSKTVPKFKLTKDGGRAPLSHKVAPDKMKFYSYLCQFLKLVKDNDAKFQLTPAWTTQMPYTCDLYLHYEDNRVLKVGPEPSGLNKVNCVAVVGTSTQLTSRMTREQFVTAVRNVGYALTF